MVLRMIFPLIISLVGLGYAFQEPTGLFISLNPIATRYKRDTNETEAIISKNDNIDAASTTETTEEVINKNKDLCKHGASFTSIIKETPSSGLKRY